jgi:E3 ubiquitin-protein ligase RNF14
MADDDDFDNPRDVELSSLSAIYPEIQQLDPNDPYTVALDVPVNPSKAVTVYFPAADDDGPPPGANPPQDGHVVAGLGQQGGIDSHELALGAPRDYAGTPISRRTTAASHNLDQPAMDSNRHD